MPETEPIEINIEARVEELKRGIAEAKKELGDLGAETDKFSDRQFRLAGKTRDVIFTMVAVRGAFSLARIALHEFGIENEFLEKTLRAIEIATHAAIIVSKLYTVVTNSERLASFGAAIAEFLHAHAKVAAATLFIGLPAAIAATVAAFAIMSALAPPPGAQFGGIVQPRGGGTPVIIGERAPEVILPLDRLKDFGVGGGGITVEGPLIGQLVTNDPDEIMRALGRRIEQLQASGV